MKNWILAHTGAAGRLAMRFHRDERGVTAVEYAVIASLTTVALLAGGATLFNDISAKFTSIGTQIVGT